jgi:hypothetical protein
VLDFTKISGELASMGARIEDERRLRGELIGNARASFAKMPPADELHSILPPNSTTSWLHAYPVERPTNVAPPPSVPDSYTALAADGSQIAPGRHDPVPYYIINVGKVSIRYGENAMSELASSPILGDMLQTEDDYSVRGFEVRREPFIAEERLIGELEALCAISETAEAPAVAYFDGSLILWSLEHSRPPQRKAEIVKKLMGFFGVCRERGIVPAGYISFPGSRDIVNDLALLACDRLPANCDACRRERKNPGDRPCTPYASLTDAELLFDVLSPGERSATFENRDSKINDDYVKLGGADNLIRYFYLRNDYEIARIEFPAWVYETKNALNTLHAIALDQCVKGGGYPRVLALAHEYALISGAESRAFRDLIEAKALPRLPSPKELAKRHRKI